MPPLLTTGSDRRARLCLRYSQPDHLLVTPTEFYNRRTTWWGKRF